MKTTLLTALFLCVLGSKAAAQPKQTPLDKYIETADSILIVNCLSAGSVNILLQADVRVQVLLVVKGTETLREITVRSQYGMEPGKRLWCVSKVRPPPTNATSPATVTR